MGIIALVAVLINIIHNLQPAADDEAVYVASRDGRGKSL